MPEGYVIRELPDGGREFLLVDPVLAWVRIDDRVHLRFGPAEIVLGGPFDVVVDGVGHHLDPRRAEELGPVLALFPGTARWLWAGPDGRLTLEFEHGGRLGVRPGGPPGAWAVEVAGPDDGTAG